MSSVQGLRTFANTTHEDIVRPGDVIEVDPDRARDLVRNKLVQVVAEEKAAPTPANKAAPEPPNKTAPPLPARRGPGRPPKVR